MPDIDSTVDIKITSGQRMVTVAIPLAGHASEDWLKGFRVLAAPLAQSSRRMLADFADATAEASAEEGPQCDAVGVADQ
jgi:hypothetical protein